MVTPFKVSVIIIGNWNPRIFTPQWIKAFLLLLDPSEEIDGLVNFEDLDFSFQYKEINITPKYNLLDINTSSSSEESYTMISEIAGRVLELLPHTPIKALGINISFKFGPDANGFFIENARQTRGGYLDFRASQIRYTKKFDGYSINIVNEYQADDNNLTTVNIHYSKLPVWTENFVNEFVSESYKILNHE